MEHDFQEDASFLEGIREWGADAQFQRKSQWRILTWQTAVFGAIALLSSGLGSVVTAVLLHSPSTCVSDISSTYSPVRGAVKYGDSRVVFDDHLEPNPFIGEPRPEVNEAWSQLLRNPYFHVNSSEYSKLNLNRSTLGVVDSEDKVMSFSVYHELHCLKALYRWIHKDHYFSEMINDSAEHNFQRWHAEHCINYLRQAAMCTASVSPITLEWFEATPGQPRPRPNPHTPRKCVDWNTLDSWAADRKVDLYDLGSLAEMPGRGW